MEGKTNTALCFDEAYKDYTPFKGCRISEECDKEEGQYNGTEYFVNAAGRLILECTSLNLNLNLLEECGHCYWGGSRFIKIKGGKAEIDCIRNWPTSIMQP